MIELFDNGDLATMISEYSQANVRIPEERVLEIFGQLTDVLAYLHETYKTDSAEVHQIVHRNLRPENILLKLNGLIGLATLRLAEEQELPRRHMDRLAPSPYLAPRLLQASPTVQWLMPGPWVASSQKCVLWSVYSTPLARRLASSQ